MKDIRTKCNSHGIDSVSPYRPFPCEFQQPKNLTNKHLPPRENKLFGSSLVCWICKRDCVFCLLGEGAPKWLNPSLILWRPVMSSLPSTSSHYNLFGRMSLLFALYLHKVPGCTTVCAAGSGHAQ